MQRYKLGTGNRRMGGEERGGSRTAASDPASSSSWNERATLQVTKEKQIAIDNLSRLERNLDEAANYARFPT